MKNSNKSSLEAFLLTNTYVHVCIVVNISRMMCSIEIPRPITGKDGMRQLTGTIQSNSNTICE